MSNRESNEHVSPTLEALKSALSPFVVGDRAYRPRFSRERPRVGMVSWGYHAYVVVETRAGGEVRQARLCKQSEPKKSWHKIDSFEVGSLKDVTENACPDCLAAFAKLPPEAPADRCVCEHDRPKVEEHDQRGCTRDGCVCSWDRMTEEARTSARRKALKRPEQTAPAPEPTPLGHDFSDPYLPRNVCRRCLRGLLPSSASKCITITPEEWNRRRVALDREIEQLQRNRDALALAEREPPAPLPEYDGLRTGHGGLVGRYRVRR